MLPDSPGSPPNNDRHPIVFWQISSEKKRRKRTHGAVGHIVHYCISSAFGSCATLIFCVMLFRGGVGIDKTPRAKSAVDKLTEAKYRNKPGCAFILSWSENNEKLVKNFSAADKMPPLLRIGHSRGKHDKIHRTNEQG